MSVGRLALLALALIAGAGAFFLMMSSQGKAPPVTIAQTSEETVKVLVASKPIQRGEKLTPEVTKWISWPKRLATDGFITDEQDGAQEALSDAIARALIVENEPVLSAKIVRKGSAGYLAALLTPGMRAITLNVSAETGAGGFILPGDKVDILVTLKGDTQDGVAGKSGRVTRTLLQNVRVLAVDQTQAADDETAAIAARTVTMELSPGDAELLSSARDAGDITLTLRSLVQADKTPSVQRPRNQTVEVIRYGRS